MNDYETLYQRALDAAVPRRLSENTEAGSVGAALLTNQGNIYTGVCIDLPCGIGFCAEHAAAAAMVTAGENRVVKLLAVLHTGEVVPPCGRCRELIRFLHPDNNNCVVYLSRDRTKTIAELLPDPW